MVFFIYYILFLYLTIIQLKLEFKFRLIMRAKYEQCVISGLLCCVNENIPSSGMLRSLAWLFHAFHENLSVLPSRIKLAYGTDMFSQNAFNHLAPNDVYISRTAQLTSRRCILNIYSTNILTEYIKHAAHCPFFFLFKMPFIS